MTDRNTAPESVKFATASDGLRIAYYIDDFTDPWTEPPTLFLLHSAMSNSRRMRAMVPYFARRFRVVRMDLRGHGASGVPREDQALTLERLTKDVLDLMAHLGLAKAHFLGASGGGYLAQQLYLDALSELAQRDARALPFGIDGCTLPAAALPLRTIAVAMARFAKADVSSPGRRAAILAIQNAMRLHPEYVSGTNQAGVQIARATGGRILVKTGAEGFMLAYIPKEGVAAALKIADGAARAREPALIALLAANGLLQPSEVRELAHLLEPPVVDSAGKPVGRLRACGFVNETTHP